MTAEVKAASIERQVRVFIVVLVCGFCLFYLLIDGPEKPFIKQNFFQLKELSLPKVRSIRPKIL